MGYPGSKWGGKTGRRERPRLVGSLAPLSHAYSLTSRVLTTFLPSFSS
jgi:hypothetical protein